MIDLTSIIDAALRKAPAEEPAQSITRRASNLLLALGEHRVARFSIEGEDSPVYVELRFKGAGGDFPVDFRIEERGYGWLGRDDLTEDELAEKIRATLEYFVQKEHHTELITIGVKASDLLELLSAGGFLAARRQCEKWSGVSNLQM